MSALQRIAQWALAAHGFGVVAFGAFAMINPAEFTAKNGPPFAGTPATPIKFLGLAMFGVGVYETSGAISKSSQFYATKIFLRLTYVGLIGTLFGWTDSLGMITYELLGAGLAAAAMYA